MRQRTDIDEKIMLHIMTPFVTQVANKCIKNVFKKYLFFSFYNSIMKHNSRDTQQKVMDLKRSVINVINLCLWLYMALRLYAFSLYTRYRSILINYVLESQDRKKRECEIYLIVYGSDYLLFLKLLAVCDFLCVCLFWFVFLVVLLKVFPFVVICLPFTYINGS